MRPIPVSVLITTYNRPLLLARMLESVARQTYKNFEVLVVDDRSANLAALQKILEPFRKKFKRFRLLRNGRNRGPQFSRNRGIQAARHPLIALADDDDEWMPEKLRRQEAIFRKDWEGTDLVYSWFELRNYRKGTRTVFRPRIRGAAFREILTHNFFPTSCVMVKRAKLLEAGLFDESLPNAQDWDMWIRLFQMGCSCDFAPAPLMVYHSHPESISYTRQRGLLILLSKHFPAFLRHHPAGIFKIPFHTAKRFLGRIRRGLERCLGFRTGTA